MKDKFFIVKFSNMIVRYQLEVANDIKEVERQFNGPHIEIIEVAEKLIHKQEIKPIDEHEWYDERFVSLNLANSDEIAFDIPDFIAPVCFNLSDVEVMAGHFGYKMVKA